MSWFCRQPTLHWLSSQWQLGSCLPARASKVPGSLLPPVLQAYLFMLILWKRTCRMEDCLVLLKLNSCLRKLGRIFDRGTRWRFWLSLCWRRVPTLMVWKQRSCQLLCSILQVEKRDCVGSSKHPWHIWHPKVPILWSFCRVPPSVVYQQKCLLPISLDFSWHIWYSL